MALLFIIKKQLNTKKKSLRKERTGEKKNGLLEKHIK